MSRIIDIEPPQMVTTVILDGERYTAEVCTVTDTHLGWEDHGLFTVDITLSSDNISFQGIGHRILGAETGRIDPTLIVQLLNILGVDTWEQVKGARCWKVIHEGLVVALVNARGTRALILNQSRAQDNE